MGVNTTRAKVAAFALSGFITGLVGAAYAFQQVTIFPQRLFDVDITVLMVVMVVIGGSGTVLGPLLGAVALQFLSEYLRQHYTDLHTFILGAIIIVAVILLPQGVVNYVREARAYRRVLAAGERPEVPAVSDGDAVLETRADARGLAGASAACRRVADVSFSVPRARSLGIIGPNGAGKSTFINLVTGHLRPTSGRVLIDGRT